MGKKKQQQGVRQELTLEYGVHANQISRWKKQLLDAAPDAILPEEKTKRLRIKS